jgi:Ca2+-binding RTX toxin-like protein
MPAAGTRLIRPSRTTLINIDGGKPTAVPNPPVGNQSGDELNLDVSALAPPVIVATLGGGPSQPGTAQSIAAPPSHRPVNFVEIEDIHLVDEGILTSVEMGDLYVRGSNNADAVSFLAAAPDVARVRVNAFQGYFTITRRAVVYGRGGNDYIQLGNFNHPAEFYGEEGDDYLAGYLAGDKLVGGLGRDRINASHGDNVVWGDRDPVEAGEPDTLENRQFFASETIPGRLELLDADILSTLDGHDVMYGGPGDDSMTLGGGHDYAYGGAANDSISLGTGDDRGYGGEGHDTITGSGGNDVLSGGEGNDSVSGDVGIDLVIGGGGNDGVNGGDGNDLLFDGRLMVGNVDTSQSQAAGDASDAAMMQLLAEWTATNPAPGPLVTAAAANNDRHGTDSVRGHAGSDALSADPADLLDFDPTLDQLL